MTVVSEATTRARIQLDTGWTFAPDPSASLRAADLPVGEPIAVPGSWEQHLGIVGGLTTAWYVLPLEVPSGWAGDDIRLRFEAVMERCEVFLDGEPIGEHAGGYLPFEVRLDGCVTPGAQHQLAVRVVNPFGYFDRQPVYSDRSAMDAGTMAMGAALTEVSGGKQTWYTATSGLIRPVSLERRPMLHLEPLRVEPDLAGQRALVAWGLAGPALGDAHDLRIDIIGPDERVVASHARQGVTSGDRGRADIAIPSPVAWTVGDPALYRVEARLVRPDSTQIDVVAARFGMRDVGTRDGRVTINGRPTYLIGALDQDYYPTTRSTVPSRAFLDEQLARARELGLNLLRCHITVPDQAYLDAADEAGILIWCELPNWGRFSAEAGDAGIATLEGMVASLGNHPSVVAWTIINEDWGTDLRHVPEHRAWLASAYDRLRAADPTRLIIDNSACGGPGAENFHVRSDLADFHVYHLTPDHADDWRARIADFASRPRWLWSPAGDAVERGDEPLVLSEFGSWGLPDPRAFLEDDGSEPWWFATGPLAGRPGGMAERARTSGLDAIFGGLSGLVLATQEHQWEALRFEIAELRRHEAIAGYVVTEFTDVYWEANGLLDMARRPKAFHDRFATINAPTVVLGDLDRRDVVAGEPLVVSVAASSWDDRSLDGGSVHWQVQVLDGSTHAEGRLDVGTMPPWTTRSIGTFVLDAPATDAAARAEVRLTLVDASGEIRARAEVPFAVLPRRLTEADLDARATEAGVRIVRRLDAAVVAEIEAGARVLLLADGPDPIDSSAALGPDLRIHARSAEHPTARAGAVWDGDWISTFSWLRSRDLADLTTGRLLDLAFHDVLPDRVILGVSEDPAGGVVEAGMFAGWVHAPAAITWRTAIGAGALTITTFRLGADRGPIAAALLAEHIDLTGRTGQDTGEEPR